MDWSDRIGRRLKPRDLHVLLAVAESGSMAKAAEALGCSRPVVSKTIAELEATLGVRLLDRTGQGAEPTRYGRALLSRSIAVFDELRKSVKEIEFLSDPGTGEVGIGCLEPLMAGIGSAAIEKLATRYPRLVFRTELGDQYAQPQFLRARKIEISLTRRPAGPSEADLDEEELFFERLAIVVSREDGLARRRKISLADLHDRRWILAPHEAAPDGPVFEGFRAAGIKMPPVSVYSYSLSLRYSLLLREGFVTAIPESALKFGPPRQFLKPLPLDLPRWQRPTIMLTLRDRLLSPAAEAFRECVRELAATLRQTDRTAAIRRT